jgi:hypothetical protein
MGDTPKGEAGMNCQWIEGAPAADDACKCGKPTVGHSSYCREHEARAWRGDMDELVSKAETREREG